MIDVRSTAQWATFSAGIGIIDGFIGAGIATLVAGSAAAAPVFAVVGGVSTVLAGGVYALCMAADAADRAEEMMM